MTTITINNSLPEVYLDGIVMSTPKYWVSILDDQFKEIDLPLKTLDPQDGHVVSVTAVKKLKAEEFFSLDMSLFSGDYYIKVFSEDPFQEFQLDQFIHFQEIT